VNSDLASELPGALQRNEIVPYYQPIVDLQTRRIVGFEVLARWHRALQIINPLEFIPLAEKAGLVGDLTDRLLHNGCLTAADWPADIQLSLNISPLLLRDVAMPDRLHRIASQARFPFRRLRSALRRCLFSASGNFRHYMKVRPWVWLSLIATFVISL